jgi:dienelactone hydrolase
MISERRGIGPSIIPPMTARVKSSWIVGVLAAAIGLGWLMMPYARSAAFLLDLSGSTSWTRKLLPVRPVKVEQHDAGIETRAGAVAARIYVPAGRPNRTLVVFPGIHAGGVDEPRLNALSHRLAATGAIVVVVPLPELREFRITSRSTDAIEDATSWVAAEPSLAPTGRVGLVGVSFAGGLALVAAGRPALAGKLDLVVSIGGHGDLPRVMTYVCTGRLPDGTWRPPHDYGAAVILYGMLPHLVPAAQVAALSEALRTFLVASSDESTDRDRAIAELEASRRLAAALPEPSHALMQLVEDRNVAALGPRLLPWIEQAGGDPALSPERAPATRVPVFLLHGADDNVIPSTEATLLAAYLAREGNVHVRALLTPLISHADLTMRGSIGNAWALVRFWKDALAVTPAGRAQ